MRLLEKFNEYYLNKILESIKTDETLLILSGRLYDIIEGMQSTNKIAYRIFHTQNRQSDNYFKITQLDIDDTVLDKNDEKRLDSISFIQSNKTIEFFAKENNFDFKNLTNSEYDLIINSLRITKTFDTKGRSTSTLGKIVKKLYGDLFSDSEIVEFVNLYKSIRIEPVFEMAYGEDIKKWYLNKNNVKGGGELNNSCMQYASCSNFLDFYVKNSNKVSLIIMKRNKDDDKIIGRALLWKLDDPDNRYFMDRVYCTHDFQTKNFIEYAKENGFLYKSRQGYDDSIKIVDGETGKLYLDEMCIYNIKDNFITKYSSV